MMSTTIFEYALSHCQIDVSCMIRSHYRYLFSIVSIVTFILIAVLVISEIRYYLQTRMKYEYDVDGDVASKLHINVDITVAMKCDCK